MSAFPTTSVTMIAKIKDLAHEDDSAEWVRFWDNYADAIRQFAAMKGGEQRADDIMMIVLGKLIDTLRSGAYTPEKGRFHSYLMTMILNEIHMAHRKDVVRKSDKHVSIDKPIDGEGDGATLADTKELAVEGVSPAAIDEDWRAAVLKSAKNKVLTQSALSDRDREVYYAYAERGEDIAVVANRFGISRNLVSQIKTRIDKRIVAAGRELLSGMRW